MLNTYLSVTRKLLQNPSTASTQIYSDADLTIWINIARGQLAGEGECIRYLGTVSTAQGQNAYNFASINTGVSATNGIQGVITIRSIRYSIASGSRWIPPRPWEWFELYVLNNPVPTQTFPTSWSQFAQGSAPGATGSGGGGSFYINVPDQAYVLNCDCVCYPNALASDADVEAIPYLWTDAVPFFAAYYALMASQTNARMADAERYFNTYNMFVARAKNAANSPVNRWQGSGAQDPIQKNKIAAGKQQGLGGG